MWCLFNKKHLTYDLLLVDDTYIWISAIEAVGAVITEDKVPSLSEWEGNDYKPCVVGLPVVKNSFVDVNTAVVNVYPIVWYADYTLNYLGAVVKLYNHDVASLNLSWLGTEQDLLVFKRW